MERFGLAGLFVDNISGQKQPIRNINTQSKSAKDGTNSRFQGLLSSSSFTIYMCRDSSLFSPI